MGARCPVDLSTMLHLADTRWELPVSSSTLHHLLYFPNAVEFGAICQWLLGFRRTCPLGPLCYTSLIPLGRRMPHLEGGSYVR